MQQTYLQIISDAGRKLKNAEDDAKLTWHDV